MLLYGKQRRNTISVFLLQNCMCSEFNSMFDSNWLAFYVQKMVSTPNYFQCSNINFSRLWTYLLVVQPIPADGPPIVTKVILYGWICHLVETGFRHVKSAFNIDYYWDYRLQAVREMLRQTTPLTVKIYFLDVHSQGCTLETGQLTVLPFRHFTRLDFDFSVRVLTECRCKYFSWAHATWNQSE